MEHVCALKDERVESGREGQGEVRDNAGDVAEDNQLNILHPLLHHTDHVQLCL
jgi:hypothetical protein